MTQAEIMREKQRKADLKKQGIIEEDEQPQPTKKNFDASYLQQFGAVDDEEEPAHQEEEKKTEEVIQPKKKK